MDIYPYHLGFENTNSEDHQLYLSLSVLQKKVEKGREKDEASKKNKGSNKIKSTK